MTTHRGIEPSTNQVTDYYDRIAESWDAKEGSERYTLTSRANCATI